jgi:septum formation protein
MSKPRLILASSSKSRLSLLKQIRIIPDIIEAANIDETRGKSEKPLNMVKRLAKSKCEKISAKYPGDIVIAADTISIVGTRVLDKTYDPNVEREYLGLIGGRRHRLISSVCVMQKNQKIFSQKTEISILKFKKFTVQEIEEIIHSREWEGCSGGYAIEGMMGKFLISVSGSVSNVMGLPLHQIYNMLTGINYLK